MSKHTVHVTAVSGNAKTGPIPVTMRGPETCPTSCPFLPGGEIGGCYGTGRIFSMATKYQKRMSTGDISAKLAGARRDARYMRDRVVGDVMTAEQTVDHEYISDVARAGADAGLTVFGYTHAWRQFTPGDVRRTADTGYVLNASCETRDDVRQAVELGMPAVIASDTVEDGEMLAGRRVVTCPAQTRDDVTCASCGLCAKPQRKAVVRFHIHGTAKRKATAAVAAAERAANVPHPIGVEGFGERGLVTRLAVWAG